ncbi:hypothetical protein G6F57_016246 [Rhizopus arrhizus]|nr:hypothetical protein G6F23_015111 [Rhizopus arrhizus]KAG0959188.1 hypothetical protein G6F31_011902 [Rhizopus arrhizus]KAG1241685.1 hypothetical protein G6F65_023394 [Rhizopus arrhizus]KAG1255835.1 hypothetical protein G6F66_014874 [Rhizopus arrhizus]KAG1451121.1 hypothetical protein G6F57_016246 [Rhizopus arrhizus]
MPRRPPRREAVDPRSSVFSQYAKHLPQPWTRCRGNVDPLHGGTGMSPWTRLARPCLVMDLAVLVSDATRSRPEGVYVDGSAGG